MAVDLEEIDAVTRGYPQMSSHIGQAAPAGVQDIQQVCRDPPEAEIFYANRELALGHVLATRGENALLDEIRQICSQIDRGSHLTGDVGPKTLQGHALIVMLASAVIAVGGYARRLVAQSHRRGDFVSVLPAGA